MKCSIDRRQLLVLVVAILAVTAVPASVVSATDKLAVGNTHTTDADFNDAQTLDNVTVDGSGDGASVVFDVDTFDDGFENEPADSGVPEDWEAVTSFDSQSVSDVTANSGSQSYFVSKIGTPAGDSRPAEQPYTDATTENISVAINATSFGAESNSNLGVYLYEGGTRLGMVAMREGDLAIYNGSWNTIATAPDGNEWVDIKIVDINPNDNTYAVKWSEPDGSSGTVSGIAFENNPTNGYDEARVTAFDAEGYVDDYRIGGKSYDSGKYVSPIHNVTNPAEAAINITAANNVTINATVQTSSGTVLNETTLTGTGNHSLTLADTSSEQIETIVDISRDGDSARVELADESILFSNHHPQVDNSSASPSGGETVSQTPVELSINVSDEDFDTAQGDNVSVTFYDASDDTEIGNETLSSNGTASASWDDPGLGEHQWYAVAEDDYGGTTTSDTFVFETPHELEIRDEENPSELINDTTTDVTVTFFGSDEVFERTTSTGVVDLSGLPDEQLIVSVDAEGYVTRQVVIDSITEQQTAYLLNESAASVDIRFRLEDPTGQFTESNSQLFVERPIQRNGTTTYRTIAGDEIGQGGYPVTLANDQRYRLILRNNQGDERALTGFMTQTSETVTLEVESVEYQFDTDNQPYKWTASYENETSEIDVAYTDKDDLTSSLTVRVIEQQNDTTVYENVWSDPSEVSTTVAVDGNETSTWLVQLEVDRDGETFELETVVGKSQFPVVGDLDEDWKHRIAVGLVFILAGLFGVANASVGALVASLSTGILWVIGWMPPSVGAPMIFVGMTIASLFYVQGSGGGIQ